jgi:hypothetical protein
MREEARMSSGLLYGLIITVWVVVLLPMWLRRHDEVVEERRSVDRFSSAMRTLSGRNRSGEQREVLMPAREAEPIEVDGRLPTIAGARARLAGRRRRTFAVLLGLLLVTAGVALMGQIPLWSIAIPGVLALAFLIHMRRQVSHQRALDQRRLRQASVVARRRERSGGASASRGLEVETVLPAARPLAAGTIGPALGEAFALAGAGPEAAPVAAAAAALAETADFYDALADSGSWEPVPVPLPTYVLAPKAPRYVRVIDLTLPGSWTSGHLDEDELAELEAARIEDARLEAEAASHVRLERAAGDGIVTGQVVIERRRAAGD